MEGPGNECRGYRTFVPQGYWTSRSQRLVKVLEVVNKEVSAAPRPLSQLSANMQPPWQVHENSKVWLAHGDHSFVTSFMPGKQHLVSGHWPIPILWRQEEPGFKPMLNSQDSCPKDFPFQPWPAPLKQRTRHRANCSSSFRCPCLPCF